mmetsp:Transcript_577/g.2404  ORF Transcript_577/g.2404 Transcript_577/m.2404 type:complete len:391 (+) Transcript_577:4295-5467(+)
MARCGHGCDGGTRCGRRRRPLAAPSARLVVSGPAAGGLAPRLGAPARAPGARLLGGLCTAVAPRSRQRPAERPHGRSRGGDGRVSGSGLDGREQLRPRRGPSGGDRGLGPGLRGRLLPHRAFLAVGGIHADLGHGTLGRPGAVGQRGDARGDTLHFPPAHRVPGPGAPAECARRAPSRRGLADVAQQCPREKWPNRWSCLCNGTRGVAINSEHLWSALPNGECCRLGHPGCELRANAPVGSCYGCGVRGRAACGRHYGGLAQETALRLSAGLRQPRCGGEQLVGAAVLGPGPAGASAGWRRGGRRLPRVARRSCEGPGAPEEPPLAWSRRVATQLATRPKADAQQRLAAGRALPAHGPPAPQLARWSAGFGYRPRVRELWRHSEIMRQHR